MTLMTVQKGKPSLTQLDVVDLKQTWQNDLPSGFTHHQSARAVEGGAKGGLRCPAPISRLQVEKIEGGLMVAGVVVAHNCQIILPVFGFLFLMVGCVLTAASYRGPGADEEPDHYAARIAFTGNSRVIGPICIVVGFIMLVAGTVLCCLAHRARRREQTVGFHCPVHGDFYPLSPGNGSKLIGLIREKNGKCSFCWPKKRGPNGVIAVGPQCPHNNASQISSKRSSMASSQHSQCPTPLPFLVKSAGGVPVPQVLVQQSPEQSFGSIRSLTVGREVASFPMSRTPSPPPSTFERNHEISIPDEEHLVSSHFEEVPVHREAPRKSLSVIINAEGKG